MSGMFPMGKYCESAGECRAGVDSGGRGADRSDHPDIVLCLHPGNDR